MHRFDQPAWDPTGTAVLVTGGTGSFGRAFVRRLLSGQPPHRLVVFSRDEQKQDAMARELRAQFPSTFERLTSRLSLLIAAALLVCITILAVGYFAAARDKISALS